MSLAEFLSTRGVQLGKVPTDCIWSTGCHWKPKEGGLHPAPLHSATARPGLVVGKFLHPSSSTHLTQLPVGTVYSLYCGHHELALHRMGHNAAC